MSDLQYKTFSSLMSSVRKSLHLYSDNNLIIDGNYIKVARKINRELGLKINQQKEEEIFVENNRAYLPENCLSIIGVVALVGSEYCQYDDHNFNRDLWTKKYRIYSLSPTRRSLDRFKKSSFNLRYKSQYQIDVDEDELSFNFESGRILIAYTADMVNEDGELLVLNHDIINEYYETAIRAEILKDLWYNMDADTQNKYQNESQLLLPPLKKKAQTIVNFPGYRKLREYNRMNEQRFYNKYYKMII